MASGLSTGLSGSAGRGGGGTYQQSGPSSPQQARKVDAAIGGQTTGYGAVPAYLSTNGLLFQAVASGSGGEAITIIATTDTGAASQALSVAVASNAITIHLATDAAGNSISTADEVRDMVEATPAATALVTVQLVSGDGSQVVAPFTSTALAGDIARSQGVASSAAPLPRIHPSKNSYN